MSTAEDREREEAAREGRQAFAGIRWKDSPYYTGDFYEKRDAAAAASTPEPVISDKESDTSGEFLNKYTDEVRFGSSGEESQDSGTSEFAADSPRYKTGFFSSDGSGRPDEGTGRVAFRSSGFDDRPSERPPRYRSRRGEVTLARDRPAVRPTDQGSVEQSRPNFKPTGRSFLGSYSRSQRTGSGVSGNTGFSSASSSNPNQNWGGYRSTNVAAYYGGEAARQRDILNKEIKAFGERYPIRTTDTPVDRPRGRGMGDTWEGPQSSTVGTPVDVARVGTPQETEADKDALAVANEIREAALENRQAFADPVRWGGHSRYTGPEISPDSPSYRGTVFPTTPVGSSFNEANLPGWFQYSHTADDGKFMGYNYSGGYGSLTAGPGGGELGTPESGYGTPGYDWDTNSGGTSWTFTDARTSETFSEPIGATNQPTTVDLNKSTPLPPPPTADDFLDEYIPPSQPYDVPSSDPSDDFLSPDSGSGWLGVMVDWYNPETGQHHSSSAGNTPKEGTGWVQNPGPTYDGKGNMINPRKYPKPGDPVV